MAPSSCVSWADLETILRPSSATATCAPRSQEAVRLYSRMPQDMQTDLCAVFAYVAPVRRANFQVLQGTPKAYEQPTCESRPGSQITRYFCGDCGTPLWAQSDAAPDGLHAKLARGPVRWPVLACSRLCCSCSPPCKTCTRSRMYMRRTVSMK